MERRARLLIKLIESNNYLSSAQLSNIFSVSTKTIFNDLEKLESVLCKFQLNIKKKPGTGLKITGSSEQKEKLKNYIFENLSSNKFEITMRQIDICLYVFIHESYVKDIAANFFISRSTVSRDINQINNNFLSQYNIKIIKKHEIFKIEGDEVTKRKVLSKLIFMKSDFNLENEILKNDVPLYINKLFNIDLNPLIEFINKLEYDFNIKFTIESKKNLLIHLAISVKRIKLGKNITSVGKIKDKLTNYDVYIPILKKDILSIEKSYSITFSEEELYLILLYIFSSKVLDKNNYDADKDFKLKTKKFVQKVSEETDYNFNGDKELLNSLCVHLEVAELRIDFELEIYNPFLKYILEHDLYLFIAVQDNINIIFDKKVPDSEVAFIVTHFMASKERSIKKKNVLIVCSSGIGISSLLKERIINNFPQYNVIGTASIGEIKQYQKVDLIISTVDLKKITDKKYVVIKPFDNIKNINNIISQINGKQQKVSIKFSIDHCWFLSEVNNKQQVLEKISKILSDNRLVFPNYVNVIKKRERIGSTYIGENVALVHGIYKEKHLVPSLNIFKLKKAINWSKNEKVDLIINFVATKSSERDFKFIFQRMGKSIDDIQFWNSLKAIPLKKIPEMLNERFRL